MVAFRTTLSQIKRRLEAFTSLPSASLDKMTLEQSARTLLNGP
jgi:hypothetical protein